MFLFEIEVLRYISPTRIETINFLIKVFQDIMFINRVVASVALPFGEIQMVGSSKTRSKKFTLASFSLNLAVPYRASDTWYEFSVKFHPEVDLEMLVKEEVVEQLVEAFELLITHPEVVKRFGKLTYTKSTTRHYVRTKLNENLLERTPHVAVQ